MQTEVFNNRGYGCNVIVDRSHAATRCSLKAQQVIQWKPPTISTEMYVRNPSNMTQSLYTLKGPVEFFCQINHGFEQKQPQFTSKVTKLSHS